jgi:hypothetical protein
MEFMGRDQGLLSLVVSSGGSALSLPCAMALRTHDPLGCGVLRLLRWAGSFRGPPRRPASRHLLGLLLADHDGRPGPPLLPPPQEGVVGAGGADMWDVVGMDPGLGLGCLFSAMVEVVVELIPIH